MKLNRNQYFMAGVIVLFLGIQLLWIDGYVLNEPTTNFLSKRMKKNDPVQATLELPSFLGVNTPTMRHTLTPPRWLRYALLSAGVVLVLHSLVLPKNEG